MAADAYEFWLTTDAGVRIQLLDETLWLAAGRQVNNIGSFSMGLPNTFDTDLVKPDRMVQVWRAPQGGRLALWRVYFVRWWRWETQDSDEVFTIGGPDCNDLLRRRIVAAYSASSQARKTDYADDMMKEAVSEALLDSADPTPSAGTRVWGDLSVQADLEDGPTLTKSFAWRRLLLPSGGGVLPSIAQAAREAGTEVFFDVVPDDVGSAGITFEFRTYTGQPGRDVTGLGVLFDQERGNLKDPFLEYDYTEEVNYVYAAGQGTQDDRNVQQVYDAGRYLASKWGRCEGFADARNEASDDGVREAGRAGLEAGRPRRRFGGIPLDTRGTRFGRDWDIGYKVRARYRGQEFDAIVWAVTISVDEDGREDIQARLEYEG